MVEEARKKNTDQASARLSTYTTHVPSMRTQLNPIYLCTLYKLPLTAVIDTVAH